MMIIVSVLSVMGGHDDLPPSRQRRAASEWRAPHVARCLFCRAKIRCAHCWSLAASSGMSERVILVCGEVEWSGWIPWTLIPQFKTPRGPGVYEVVYENDPDGQRLQIGETIHLGEHLRKNLFRDRRHMAVGGRIKANEDVTQLLVRWAETENYRAVKSELKGRHLATFGRLPKYMKR
jgi:hypothetical protein